MTATRRTESVEKVPVSITALEASDLAVANIKSIDDLQQLVPGLQFTVPNGFSFAFTTMSFLGTYQQVLFWPRAVQIITLLMVLFEGLGSIAAAILFEKSSHRPIHYR